MSPLQLGFTLGRLMRDAAYSGSDGHRMVSRRLKRVLIAAASVPHFQEVMGTLGYDPVRDYRGPQDLALFPVMRKSDVKAQPGEFVRESEADCLGDHFLDRTSGSTGVPLTVYRAKKERALQIAKWLRVLIANGYRFSDKVLSYTAPSRLSEGRTLLQHLGLLRRRAVSYRLSPAESAAVLLQYCPDVVYGVRTSLVRVAEELSSRGIAAPPLKLLVAGGEVIEQEARDLCRRVFGIDITETYGSIEMGVMAYQRTGQAGLHLIQDCTYFEFLDSQGNPAPPGRPARVVVTDLFGWLMPFLRYEQGDLVVYSEREGSNGEVERIIDRVLGRQDDLCPLPDGSSLSFLDFYDVRYGFPQLRQIRVTQLLPLSFLVEAVAEQDYFRAIADDLSRRLQKLSPLGLEFDVRCVERIDPDPAGKMRMLVSRVNAARQGR